MKLEVYAAKLFSEFCKNQKYDNHYWDYLAYNRKLAWIKEAYFLLKTTIIELKNSFKPHKILKTETSYEIGYYQGLVAERLATISYLDYLLDELDLQYEELKKKYSN